MWEGGYLLRCIRTVVTGGGGRTGVKVGAVSGRSKMRQKRLKQGVGSGQSVGLRVDSVMGGEVSDKGTDL